MANHIEANEIEKIGKLSYDKIRDTLQTGDLLFASGNYFFSKLIRRVTKSAWSHVGIIVRLENQDRILLLESVEDMGVRFAPLSKYVGSVSQPGYNGKLVIARYKSLNKKSLKLVLDFGLNELTKPYDRLEVLRILWRILSGRGRKERNKEFICSELVFECFANAGVKFEYDPKGFISPENIWSDRSVIPLARLN